MHRPLTCTNATTLFLKKIASSLKDYFPTPDFRISSKMMQNCYTIHMEWIICHRSALEFWRKSSAREALAGKKMSANKLALSPPNAEELRTNNPWGLSMPLHVLVGNSNARKVSKSLVSHVGSGQFPHGSFIRVAPGLITSSPELCFMQSASKLDIPRLVALGLEFCGGYRLEKKNKPGRGFRDDAPLTSAEKLTAFVTKAAGLRGRTKALRALRFIADNSGSPMETALVMMLTLPYSLGGYGLPMPLLNCPISVSTSNKKATKKKKYRCDLYWPEAQVSVEYDSDTYHTGSDRIAKDAIRRNAISSAGVIVLVVSRKQVVSTAELREVAIALSKLLDKRLVLPMPKFIGRHALLRSQLLPTVPDEQGYGISMT